MPDGLRKMVVSPVFGSYFQMLPACRNLPDSSLHSEVKVMSEKYMKPSGPAATPSVSTQPPSNSLMSLESAGSTLASPSGGGKPESSPAKVLGDHRPAELQAEAQRCGGCREPRNSHAYRLPGVLGLLQRRPRSARKRYHPGPQNTTSTQIRTAEWQSAVRSADCGRSR